MVDKYVKPSISGFNANPPPDDDSETAANAISWSKHKTKLADPIKTLLDAVNTATDELADGLFGNAVRADSAGGNLATSDYGKLIKTSNAVTITLLTGGDAGSNFVFAFYNADSTNNLTIARNGNNINGAASNLTITPGEGGIAFCDGTDWWVLSFLDKTKNITFSGILTLSGTIAGATPFVLEGTTADDFETSIAVTDPTADRTITIPDVTGTILTTGNGQATQDEQETGTSTTTYVTPGRQQYHKSACKAYARFNGTGTIAIIDSYNLDGATPLTDNNTGDYSVNFNVDFSGINNYCGVGSAGTGATPNSGTTYCASVGVYAAGSARCAVSDNNTDGQVDAEEVSFIFFGDQ